MKKTWDQLSCQLAPFFERLPPETADSTGISETEVDRLAADFRGAARSHFQGEEQGFLHSTFLKQLIDLRHHLYRQQRRLDKLSRLGEGDEISDLRQFLVQTIDDLHLAHAPGAEIHFTWDKLDQVNLKYPPRLLYQALEILVENSLSHNPSIRPVPVHITLHSSVDEFERCVVCIEYRDRGKGISPAARDLLFLNGFHEAPNPGQPTDTLNRGRGLHLALRSISHYGGEIRLEDRKPEPEDRELLPENVPAVFSIRFLNPRISV